MKNIDWNKAPSGATHHNSACVFPWLRDTTPSFYNGECWVEYTSDDIYWEEHISKAIKRPQEWDGNGVPPVGTVCEYCLDDGWWSKCKVVYVLSGSDDGFVVWCDHLDSDKFLSFSTGRYRLYLRKIKTPEQIAEEEKSKAIDEMNDLILGWGVEKRMLAVLYDAGYRKQKGDV